MIELPEAAAFSSQINASLSGRILCKVHPPSSPHRLTWFTGEAAEYPSRLEGLGITGARGCGGIIEISFDNGSHLWLSDGASPRLYAAGVQCPVKYQLMAEMDDGSAVAVIVAMYGGIQIGKSEDCSGMYFKDSFTSPSPLSDDFSEDYFDSLYHRKGETIASMSAKAFLATQQRIPGLGNGVLQDVLWHAGIHPKRKISTLSDGEKARLYDSIKTVLKRMTDLGGRDTETDLYGRKGGYGTVMSRVNTAMVCPSCGGGIRKENYLGGSILFCPYCQPLPG